MNSNACQFSVKKTPMTQAGLFFILCLCALFVCGCNRKSVALSFAVSMDNVDASIAAGSVKDATAQLKKLSRSASGVSEYFALYKRYIKLGDAKEAERIMKKAYRKNPKQNEVVAVYAHFLLSRNNLEEAAKVAASLTDTAYRPILTEIKLRQAANDGDYLKHEFVKTFCDAAAVTGNEAFLRNAAIIEAYNGFIQEAVKLHPRGNSYYNDDKFFWALISYDAGNFTQSFIDLDSVENSDESLLLKADAALYLDEQKAAYTLWQRALEQNPHCAASVYGNLAHYANLNGMQTERGNYLIALVNNFPSYTPGVASYGWYAYDVTHQKNEDDITSAVRRAGFKSLRMEQLDTMPIVPVEDALSRMDALMSETNDMTILVERLKLQWKDSVKSNEDKLVDVWLALEKYPDNEQLNHYAAWLLCILKRYDQARAVFDKYLTAKYQSCDYASLGDKLSAQESEYAAYLSTRDVLSGEAENYAVPTALYKSLVARNSASVPVLMNYGALLVANADYFTALDLYTRAAKLTANEATKAEIQYRLARIYVEQHDSKMAQMCLTYCLQLNPDHAKARLLYKQLEVR